MYKLATLHNEKSSALRKNKSALPKDIPPGKNAEKFMFPKDSFLLEKPSLPFKFF